MSLLSAGQMILGGANMLFGESDEQRRNTANRMIMEQRNQAIGDARHLARLNRGSAGQEFRNSKAGNAKVLERIQRQTGTFGSSAGQEQIMKAGMGAGSLLTQRINSINSDEARGVANARSQFRDLLPNTNQGVAGGELFATGLANALETNTFENTVKDYFKKMNTVESKGNGLYKGIGQDEDSQNYELLKILFGENMSEPGDFYASQGIGGLS